MGLFVQHPTQEQVQEQLFLIQVLFFGQIVLRISFHSSQIPFSNRDIAMPPYQSIRLHICWGTGDAWLQEPDQV